MTQIDGATQRWQIIYEMSEAMLTPPDHPHWVNMVCLDDRGKSTWSGMRDLRTIHMGGGRQNAKSTWTSLFMKQHPKAVAIEIDKHMRNQFIHKLAADDEFYHRVFTVADINAIIRTSPDWLQDVLGEATHVLFNEASYNNAIVSPQFRKMMDYVFRPSTVIVMMG